MDLLNVSGFESAKATVAKPIAVPMTLTQAQAVKDLLRSEGRGYSLQVNSFDINVPYRVSINYANKWDNYGSFASVDVAAAVGSIVSRGYFGKIAKIGKFDATVVANDPAYKAFLADSRNVDIIARARGEKLCIHDENAAVSALAEAA